MQRSTRFGLIAVAAILIVASVATVAAVSQSRATTDERTECSGDPMKDPADCPSHERMRRHCREHPREPRCQRWAAAQADRQ